MRMEGKKVKPMGTGPSTSVTINNTVNLMIHKFSSSLEMSENLSLFLFSLVFTQ